MLRNAIIALAILAPVSAPVLAQDVPEPGLELVYRSTVMLGETIEVGETARGYRRLIPITGGTFEGPDIRGIVMSMGWDWQLARADGCLEIVADYFLRTDDGVMINVVNSGVICPQGAEEGANPIRTSPVFEVPRGEYEWLGQGAYIGTLGFDPTAEHPAVEITIYRAN